MEGSVTAINRPKRLPALDLAKALAIIFMVFVHVYEVSVSSGALIINTDFEMFWRNFIEFTGGVLSAGVFTFVMGFLVGNSKSKTKEKLVKEAGHLFLLALLVNVFQQWIPVLFRGNIVEDFIENMPAILATDIYSFDSLCMLCLALVFCFKEEKRTLVALVAVCVAIVLSMTIGYVPQSTGNVWADTVLGMFVRINEWSYFPLFNWLPFPFIGFVIGYRYRTKGADKKHLAIMLAIGALAIFYAVYMMNKYGLRNSVGFGSQYTEGDYYAISGYNRLAAFGIITMAMAAYLFIVKNRDMQIPKVLSFMSTNVSDVYVIQWMLIGLLTYPLDRITNIFVNMLMALLILIATLLLTQLKLNIKKNTAK